MATLTASFFKRFALTIGAASVAMAMVGCTKQESKTESENKTANTTAEAQTINIGFQKYGTLPILKARGTLEQALAAQNIQVKWVEFPAGPQMLEGLNVGSVVFGEVGDAPPIFAQAANDNLVYVAHQPESSKAEALIVPKDSPIKTVADLKGKRVALNKGSNVHYLLLKVLEANGLTLQDIEVSYLTPSDARAAFERGAVDAWVIWDPFYAAAEHQIGARKLQDGEGLVTNYQFYMSDRKFAEENSKVVNTIVEQVSETSDWVKANPAEAAKILEKPTGLSLDILNTSIGRIGLGVQQISPDTIAKQQLIADAFYQQKLIPKQIKIDDAILKNQVAQAQ